ncbi:uncharacterized protein L969DRAFT_79851 [Mixia osmundae IAM 14324]|uniref:uncharacterized protein n=1 Tax=Mixia osmundae (strain CBS 9802 / IAM 14324 / JCM 22182 / KY 12970) TaxID=764103 RepID=UPI0004A55117|nr:uncharacterized protein L969DRAFT_79851 [Mixia osmundae IAM 14324]KEI36442.1 hypothetical protein L969DRAFT_79851 [Mixia osmundae IAM 14324]
MKSKSLALTAVLLVVLVGFWQSRKQNLFHHLEYTSASSQWSSEHTLSHKAFKHKAIRPTGAACDPFREDGYLLHYPDNRTQSWIPHRKACPPAPDWWQRNAQAQEAYAKVSWLANRTIFVMGDSVDRNMLDHFAYFVYRPMMLANYYSTSIKVQDDPRMANISFHGTPRILHFHKLNLTIITAFFYGSDDTGFHASAYDVHPPLVYEERAEKLLKPFIDLYTDNRGPDLIRLHTGMWDLVAMPWQSYGFVDKASNETNLPMLPDDLSHYKKRVASVFAKTKELWPNVPVWVRILHRVGTAPPHQRDDKRSHAIISVTRYLAKRAGLPFFDYGHILRGYSLGEIHPLEFVSVFLFG